MTAALLSSLIVLFSAFEYRSGDPACLFPFTIAAEDTSIPGIYMNPSTLTGREGFTIGTYGSRPYSMDELHSYGSGAKYSTDRWGSQILWHSFGTEFYRENMISAGAGLSPWDPVHAGAAMSAYLLNIDTDDDSYSRSMYDMDISLTVEPFRWINFSFIQTGAAGSISGKNGQELYPEWSAGILIKPSRGFSLAWNITDTAPCRVNSFAASVNPAAFLSIRGGYTVESSQFAASFSFLLKRYSASYGLSSHPYLGYTHSISLTFSTETSAGTIEYSSPPASSLDKKININRATPEEIRNIPGLGSRSSERLILHREKIGPLSEKSLIQIGLDSNEIYSLKQNTYGLSREQHPKNRDDDYSDPVRTEHPKKHFIPVSERVKERFRKLIKQGIPAGTAIRYSELPDSAERGDMELILESDASLTDQQKDAVRRICMD